ncbi:lipid-A-disaccharide synthase [Thalassospira marina]|uniref:Lipid-A-disaccharide synthase n=1 Tax=Thalassospira marina TaxID=2048283 RepID=A0ABM6QEK4_9PROT|nr:lipid-A-disaccharide synthase [Thalassospira marina]AUG55047.1 lipid-A-disaccharide synthase [Thalassospira marina]
MTDDLHSPSGDFAVATSSITSGSAASRPLKIMLVAGEASGDQLGGRLMAALKRQHANITFIGVGGPRMIGEGMQSLFSMNEMSVMGLAEIIPHIPRLLRRIRETADLALAERPDVVVTIDAPDFSFRVGKKLATAGIPLVHYVAPSVWAWRPGRARKIAKFLDHLLALLPFEPPYFEREGLATTFIGHSAVEERHGGDAGRFRAQHGLTADQKVIAILPGSRHSEVSRLLPVFRDVVVRLANDDPDACFVMPTVSKVEDTVRQVTSEWPVKTVVVATDQERRDAFSCAHAALAASGTVSLELGIVGVPHVIGYRVSATSAWLARKLLKVDTVTIINLVLGRKLVPEYLQEDCTADKLYHAMKKLNDLGERRDEQLAGFDEATTLLGFGQTPPSDKAASVVLEIAQQGKQQRPK